MAARVSYQLGRDVTLLMQDDTARLLDLERGRFYALNASAAHLLTLTLRNGPEEAVRQAAREQGVEEDRVRADWATVLAGLRQRRLLTTRRPFRRRVLPGRVHIWLLLALAWLSFRVLGWAKTLRLWRRGRSSTAQACPASLTPLVQQLDQSVREAAALHPLNPQCKERALVAWHLLRNCWGLSAELVVGVLAFPFEAHAWVECGPLTLTDNPARCEMYITAVRYS